MVRGKGRMLKCTINNQPIEVKEGSTIIEAFHKLR